MKISLKLRRMADIKLDKLKRRDNIILIMITPEKPDSIEENKPLSTDVSQSNPIDRRKFQFSIAKVLGMTAVAGGLAGVYRNAIRQAAIVAFDDVRPQQIEALEMYIEEFNSKRDHWMYGDLVEIRKMITTSQEIAGLMGTSFKKVLSDEGQDPAVLAQEIRKLIPAMMDDLITDEPVEVPRGTLSAVRDWYRDEPSKAIDEAVYLTESFNIKPEQVSLTDEKKKKVLLKGMERCLLRWSEEDPKKECFATSVRFKAFCNNLAMLIEDSPDPKTAIADVLGQDKFFIDPNSQDNVYVVVSQELAERTHKRKDSESGLPSSDTLSLK